MKSTPRRRESATTTSGRRARRGLLEFFPGSGASTNRGGRSRARVGASTALLTAGLALAGLALAAPAFADHSFDRFLALGTGGTGGQHSAPRAIAVNEAGTGGAAAGDIYVADAGNHRIQVFDAQGSFKFAFGRDVIAAGAAGDQGEVFEKCTVAADCKAGAQGSRGGELIAPQGIAINQTTGDVYVRERAGNVNQNLRVQQFDATGEFIRAWGWGVATGAEEFEICTDAAECQSGISGGGIGQFAPAALGTHTGIAVNQTTGEVFVTDPGNSQQRNNRVQRFQADGTSPQAFGTTTQWPNNNLPTHVAVDADGIVYANGAASSNAVIRYDSVAETFLAPLDVASLSGTANTATSALAVDPSTDDLLVARSAAVGVLEFSEPGGGSAAHVGTHVAGFGITPQGLAVNPATGNLYLSATAGAAGHGVYSFDAAGTGSGTDIAALDVSGSNATATTIDLIGTVDPDDGLVRARFEFSPDGTSWTALTPVQAVGSGPQAVSTQLTGLDPNSFYRVRLVVEKVLGPNVIVSVTSAEDVILTAAAPPAVTTFSPANRTDTSAQLRAFIDPNGSATTYRFEWGGAGGSFDHHVPIPDASAGSGNTEVMVVETIAGLLPETAYQYRIVATNPTGTAVGDTVTFTTQATPGPPSPQADRGFELVSPAYKIGGIGVGNWGSSFTQIAVTGLAAQVGERFAPSGNLGSILGEGDQTFANDWVFAERAGDQAGWQSHSPFTHASHLGQFATFAKMHAAAPDLSKVAWRTNNVQMAFFPEMADWGSLNPSLISDWGSPPESPTRWEVFGPTDREAQMPESIPPSTDNMLCELAFAASGSHAACSTWLFGGIAAMRGLAGPGDPTASEWPDLVAGRSVYLADVSGELADNLPDSGPRELVNVCADATELPSVNGSGDLEARVCPDPGVGRDASLVSERGATTQSANSAPSGLTNSMRNVVSADGSRVFFMSPDPLASGVPNGTSAFCSGTGEDTLCPPQLYVRQKDPDGSVTTRWISRAADDLFESQEASLTGRVIFEGASKDGRRVFFRTNSPLTADDPNGSGSAPVTEGTASNDSWDLYLYEFPEDPEADIGDGELTRISGGPGGAGDCNSPLGGATNAGALRFAADDGSRAYFTCQAPLPGVPTPQSGTITAPGGTPTTADRTNLYVYDTTRPEAERWRFIARIPRATSTGIDSCASAGVDPAGPLNDSGAGLGFTGVTNCVYGTADGAFVTFWTRGRLTADDPDEASADIYGYDADRDELLRITAPQGGVGGTYACGTQGPAASTPCYGDGGYDDYDARRRGPLQLLRVAADPLEPDERVAFFQSRSRLVPEDQNDVYDVYEWRDGELSLVSTGAPDADHAFYRGNDTTGRNVYLVTGDRLSWQDTDAVLDIYTARIGGGIPEPVAPPVCDVLGGDCQSAPTPPPPAPEPAIAPPPPAEADPPEARNCAQLQRQARQATQRAKNLRQRAKKLRQRAKRQARRGNAQRAKRLRQRANNRVQPRARNQRQRAQRLRTEARECREAQQPRRAR